MSSLAARRLIDASVSLDAADRALLNIWVTRGLDDAALARMIRISEETIADRRARIVECLSTVLGLPAEDVRSTLTEIVASRQSPAASADPPAANGAAPAVLVAPSVNGPAPRRGDPADTDATAASGREADTGSSLRRRQLLRNAFALLAIIAVAVVLVISLGSSGSGHHRGPAARQAPGSAQNVPPTSATTPNPSPTASRPSSEPLVALPRGLAQATGAVQITRSGPHLRLDLSVSTLPAASHGHYEVWLYDSIVYSEPLGRLRTGVRHISLALPADASRYHWIDISFQPVGVVLHSGQSLMRSTNPLFGKAAAGHP